MEAMSKKTHSSQLHLFESFKFFNTKSSTVDALVKSLQFFIEHSIGLCQYQLVVANHAVVLSTWVLTL